jgi:hypothetical protein
MFLGTTTDGSVDYSVGNYEGIFKIKSVVNMATPNDSLVINSSGNVGIGKASHATYKLDVNGDINISSGSQFRIGNNVLSTLQSFVLVSPAHGASIRQHTSAYVSIRQHTSAYVSIRQHT